MRPLDRGRRMIERFHLAGMTVLIGVILLGLMYG